MRGAKREVISRLVWCGYRVTPQRRAILEEIVKSRGHLTPALVYERVKRDFPQIGLVTVYRSLEMLSKLGLVCRIHTGRRSQSYTLAPPKHHHHLVCSKCNMVVDFYDCTLNELEERLSKETGFQIKGHILQLFGLCKNCQKKKNFVQNSGVSEEIRF